MITVNQVKKLIKDKKIKLNKGIDHIVNAISDHIPISSLDMTKVNMIVSQAIGLVENKGDNRMSRVKKILEFIEMPIIDGNIQDSMTKEALDLFISKLSEFGYEGVTVEDILFDAKYNSFLLSLKDTDDDQLVLMFGFDENDSAYVIPLADDYDELDDDQEFDILDIESVLPENVTDIYALVKFDWLTPNIMKALLSPGKIGSDDFYEKKVDVIRGAKKVKMMVKRKVKESMLSKRQRGSLKEAQLSKCNSKLVKDLKFSKSN